MAGDAPLEGIAVVEAGSAVAVRYCGRLFAQLGARVIQAGAGGGTGLLDQWLGERKTSAPDLTTALADLAATDRPRRLVIGGADAALTARLEAWARDQADPPVLLSIDWYDRRGPHGAWLGNDPVIQALCGVAYGFGLPEGPPTLPQGFAPQTVAGLTGFIAALAALLNPAPTVRRIETSVLEAALCFVETGAIAAWASGLKGRRLGVNRFAPTYPCSIYPTLDGHLGVTALTNAQWRALAGLIGRPEAGGDPRLATTLQRLAAADEIDAMLGPALARRTTDYWTGEGARLRIPLTPAPRPSEAPRMSHWRERGAFAPLGGSAVQAPTLPFRFDFDGERSQTPEGGRAGPLTGVRVADFGMGWAGPLAGRYLGDLGADVLKIESRAYPDWWRGWEAVEAQDPPPREVQRNFMAVNRSKRGLDLDLSRPEDRRAAAEIIRRSDVALENQGPGVMDRLGLGLADQRRLNPKIVSIAMPPFGRTGPLSGVRAYGSTVEQASGMPFVNGQAGWKPCHQHVAYGDPVAGLYAAAAALIGLHARARLGGCLIDFCQVECLFQLGADAIIAEQALGAPLPRTGSRQPDMAPCCVVRAGGGAEDWLAVAADSDGAFAALCAAIGRPDLGADPALATLAGRKAREAELEAAVANWAAGRPAADAAAALQAAGTPAAPVLGAHDLCADPHLVACGYFGRQTRRYVGEHLTPRSPFRFDGERPPLGRPAPMLGEHTAEVLAELGIEPVQAPT